MPDLDAQAERQRRRAPEPGPVETPKPDYGAKVRRVRFLLLWVLLPVFVLLALTLQEWVFWAFWIGFPVACGVGCAYLAISSD
jgi:hypothetical protein